MNSPRQFNGHNDQDFAVQSQEASLLEQVLLKSKRKETIKASSSSAPVVELRPSSKSGLSASPATSHYTWASPQLLNASSIAQLEFPVDACGTLLAPVIREISEICQAPLGLAAHAVLAACSFAVQRLYNCGPIGSLTEEPCSLFILSIAESGDRKSAVDRLASRVIHKWEKSCVQDKGFPCQVTKGAECEEVTNSHVSPQSIAIFTDVTYADLTSRLIKNNYPSIGIFSDEAGTFFGNYSMTSATRQSAVSGYVTLWNSGEVSRFRLTDELGSGKVFNRRLTINLMSQPVAIQETLSDSYLLGQGFLPRFLITNPPSRAGTRFLRFEKDGENVETSKIINFYENKLSMLMESPLLVDVGLGVVTATMPVSVEAKEQFVHLYNEYEKEMFVDNESLPAQIRPFQARIAQHARRIATILAVMNDEDSVSANTMVSAFQIAEHSLETWKNLVGSSHVERLYAEAQQLLEWISARPTVRTVRNIQRYGPRFVRVSVERLRSLLELLEDHSWIKYSADGKSIIVNPQALPVSQRGQ